MALFAWDSSFETGNAMIDQQHQRLVALINELGDALAGHLQDRVPDNIYRQLVDYTRYHFASEEKLMRSSGMDPESFRLHQASHADFIRTVDPDNQQPEGRPEALLSYLVDWLVRHILESDCQMVKTLGVQDAAVADSNRNTEQQLLGALRESESRFRLLADSAPVMLWLSRADGRRTFFNQAWLEATAADPEAIGEDGWQQLIHPDDLDDYLHCYQDCHQRRRGAKREFRLLLADGSSRWVLEDSRARFVHEGVFVGLTGSCMDISAQKESQQLLEHMNAELENLVDIATRELQEANRNLREEAQARLEYQRQLEREKHEQQLLIKRLNETSSQLLQSEKMSAVGQLAAGVAHEINNPVGYVRSNITTLSDYLGDFIELLQCYESMEDLLRADPQRLQELQQLKLRTEPEYLKQDTRELLQETGDGLERVRKIVQDLKDFSRVDDTEWQYADLHKGLDSTLNVASNEIKYRATVIKEYGELPLVRCLPGQLNQVFMNLLVNAAQAVSQAGEIRIRTGCVDGMAQIRISDTGSGIPVAVRERIFEPFFTTKPVGQGTGLGLSVSYGIVRNHQGSLSVESEEGRGSTFTVRIPLQEPPV